MSMNSEQKESTQDDLLERYRQASELDGARPGPQVRAAVLAHARAVAAAAQAGPAQRIAGALPAASLPPRAAAQREASNSPNWRLQALGSLAVLGLVGLLYIQFERGSEEERGIALGTGSPPVSAPGARPAPAAATAPVAVVSPQNPAPAAPAEVVAAPAQNMAATRAAPSRAQPAAQAPRDAVRRDSAPQASADVSGQPAPMAAAPMQAPAAVAPAAGAKAMRETALAGPAASRAVAPDSVALGLALRLAAQQGDAAQIDALILRGAPLEAGDEVGRSALLLAVMQGQRAAVARLLAAGANAQAADRDGVSALRLAQSRSLAEIEALLRQYGAR